MGGPEGKKMWQQGGGGGCSAYTSGPAYTSYNSGGGGSWPAYQGGGGAGGGGGGGAAAWRQTGAGAQGGGPAGQGGPRVPWMQQPQQQQPQRGPTGSGFAEAKPGSRYTAHGEGGDGTDKMVLATLSGDFVQTGSNHGKPVFQKVAARPGEAPPAVFLYFWDERDGPDFSGWWFGKEVGGDDIWAQSRQKTLGPPTGGWRIPHTGPVCDKFFVEPTDAAGGMSAAPSRPAAPAAPKPAWGPSSAAGPSNAMKRPGSDAFAEQASLDEMLAEATEVVLTVEEAVEQQSRTFDSAQAEQFAEQAQAHIKEGLAFIGRKTVSAKSYVSKEVRERATSELGALRVRLLKAGQKAQTFGKGSRPTPGALPHLQKQPAAGPGKGAAAGGVVRPFGSAAAAGGKQVVGKGAMSVAQKDQALADEMMQEVEAATLELEGAVEAAVGGVDSPQAKPLATAAQQVSGQTLAMIFKKSTELKKITDKELLAATNKQLNVFRARCVKAGQTLRSLAQGARPPSTPPPQGKAPMQAPPATLKPGLLRTPGMPTPAGKVGIGQAAGVAAKPFAAAASASRYTVSETSGNQDETLQMLLGDYAENGTNHNRPTYQKDSADGSEVCIFYWDARDGADFEGWYFGQAAGSEVQWAFCKSKALKPPRAGWRIPVDGVIRPSFVVAAAVAGQDGSALLGKAAADGGAAALSSALPKDKALWTNTVDEAASAAKSMETLVEQAVSACDGILDKDGGAEADQDIVREKELHTKATAQMKDTFSLISEKLMATKGFMNPVLRAKAARDIGALRMSLSKADVKLKSMTDMDAYLKERKTIRDKVKEDQAAFARIEAEVARIAEMCKPFTSEEAEPTQELLKQAEQAITACGLKLTPFVRTLKGKMALSKGTMKDEYEKMQGKVEQAAKQLNEIRLVQRRLSQKGAAEAAMKEVAEFMRTAKESVKKLGEATEELSAGTQGKPPNEVKKAVEGCDEALKAATNAVALARPVVSKRWAEVQKLQDEAGKLAQERIKGTHAELETLTKKLTELRNTAKTKREEAAKAEPMIRVSGVETLVGKIREQGELINEESKLSAMSSADIRQAGVAVRSLQAELFTEMQGAQKVLVTRQIDAKRRNDAAEIAATTELQERLRAVQVEANKFKVLPPSVEKHIASQRHVDEGTAKVVAAEESLEKTVEMIAALSRATEKEAPAEGAEGAEEGEGGGASPAPAEPAGSEPVPTFEDTDAAVNAVSTELAGVFRWLSVTGKAKGLPEDEAEQLKERIRTAQNRLKEARPALAIISEKRVAAGMLLEADVLAKQAEDAVAKATELATAILEAPEGSGENVAVNEGLATAFKETSKAAKDALKRAFASIKEKQDVAKSLSETVCATTLAELGSMQEFVDLLSQEMTDIHTDACSRIYGATQRDVETRMSAAESKAKIVMQVVTEITERTGEGKEGVEPMEMQQLLDRGSAAQEEAAKGIKEMISTLQGHLRDLGDSEAPAKADFKQKLTKLVQLEGDNNKQKKLLMEHEQQFVAQHVLKIATPMVEELEAKLEKLQAASAPLLGDAGKKELGNSTLLAQAMDAVVAYASSKVLTPQAVFDEMRGTSDAVGPDAFLKFVMALPQMKEHIDGPMSEAQVKTAYSAMDSVGGGQVRAEQIAQHMRRRFRAIAETPLRETREASSGVSRALEADEVVEAMELVPRGCGSASVVAGGLFKAKAETDGAEGFTKLGDPAVFELLSPLAACILATDRAMDAMGTAVAKTSGYLQQKGTEMKALSSAQKSAATREAEDGLMRLRSRASQAQAAHMGLKRKVTEAKAEMAKKAKAEAARKEAAAKSAAVAAATKEVNELVDGAVAEVDAAAAAAAAALLTAAGTDVDEGKALTEIDTAGKEMRAALASLAKSQAAIAEKQNDGADATLKRFWQVSAQKLAATEARCRLQLKGLDNAAAKLALASEQAIREAVKVHARNKCMGPSALFKELAGGAGIVPASSLRAFVERIGGMTEHQLEMGMRKYSDGVPKLAVMEMAQDFRKVVKNIVITDKHEIKSASVLRKLELGEVVEVLGELKSDMGLERARCRTVRDNEEGWITLRGNQGTPFFDATSKPYLSCKAAGVVLRESCGSAAPAVSTLPAGEVLEILQGPAPEAANEVVRIRGKAKKDGKIGWVTLRESSDSPASMELMDGLVCRCSIGMSAEFEGTILRKLEVGEFLEQLEEPREDPEKNLSRVRVKSRTDDQEGWVTMTGSEGKQYVVENTTHYTCSVDTPLEVSLSSGSTKLRMLEAGEAFDVLEGPTVEKKTGALFVHCRTVRDGREGWCRMDASVVPWAPRYRVKRKTELQSSLEPTSSLVRSLEAFEALDAWDVPRESDSVLRVEVRADGDGARGFATVRGEGVAAVFLEPILDSP